MTEATPKVDEAVRFLTDQTDIRPAIGVLTGTGLGSCLRSMAVSKTIAYADIPHFPISTVQGHPGRLLFGRLGSRPVIVLQGRLHLYEGYSPQEVVFPIRVLQTLGLKAVVVTNAAGGINPELSPGDIMVIADHLNLTGANPLTGANIDRWGIRFPDMSRAYTAELASLAVAAGGELNTAVHRGIYAGLAGPSLETPAEVRMLRALGADAVGFSTVHEVIAAVHGGMKVLGLSIVTNVHDPDRPEAVTVEEVISVAQRLVPCLDGIIKKVVSRWERGKGS